MKNNNIINSRRKKQQDIDKLGKLCSERKARR